MSITHRTPEPSGFPTGRVPRDSRLSPSRHPRRPDVELHRQPPPLPELRGRRLQSGGPTGAAELGRRCPRGERRTFCSARRRDYSVHRVGARPRAPGRPRGRRGAAADQAIQTRCAPNSEGLGAPRAAGHQTELPRPSARPPRVPRRRRGAGPRPCEAFWAGVRGSLKPGWGGNSRGARAPGEDSAPTLSSQSAPL